MGARLTQLGHRLHLHSTSMHGAFGKIEHKYEHNKRAAKKAGKLHFVSQNSFCV